MPEGWKQANFIIIFRKEENRKYRKLQGSQPDINNWKDPGTDYEAGCL